MKQIATHRRPGGRSARVRQAVIAASMAELASKGYEQFSISAVARSAGVHQTSIYRRWKSRDVLILDTLSAAHMAPVPDSGNLYRDLCQLLAHACAWTDSPLDRSLMQMAAAAHPGSPLYPMLREFWQQRVPTFEAVFARGILRGEWDARRPFRLKLDALFGAITWRMTITHEGVTSREIEELVAMHCRDGLVGG